jgi:hypothetical protein
MVAAGLISVVKYTVRVLVFLRSDRGRSNESNLQASDEPIKVPKNVDTHPDPDLQ